MGINADLFFFNPPLIPVVKHEKLQSSRAIFHSYTFAAGCVYM